MNDNDTKSDRRNFIKGAAAAGFLGAVGVPPAFSEEPRAQGQAMANDEPVQAPSLPAGGLLDQRYPISYRNSIPAAVRVMTDYFAALSQRDLKGMAEMCHFPFASFEG